MRRVGIVGGLVSMLLAVVYLLPASATASATQQEVPISGSVVNPCNDEIVTWSGVAHFVFNTVSDGSGGFNAQLNIHLTGTGDQGNRYVGEQTQHFSVHVQPGQVVTETSHFTGVSQGSAPNFKLDIVEHITVTPDGTLTATVDNVASSCAG